MKDCCCRSEQNRTRRVRAPPNPVAPIPVTLNPVTLNPPACVSVLGPRRLLLGAEPCREGATCGQMVNTLKDKPDVLALAFQVNYWDRLG